MAEKEKQLTKLTLKNIVRRTLRSYLTILSVVIGIASVVALVLLSDGLFNAMNDQFSKWGSNTAFVMPTNFNQDPRTVGRVSQDVSLTMNDVDLISELPEIDKIVPFIIFSAKVTYKNDDAYVQCMAAPADKVDDAFDLYSMNIAEGKSFDGKEGHYAVIGPYIANDLFDGKIKPGNTIKINDTDFKVVGILEPIGNIDDDSSVYISIKVAKEIGGFGDVINYISIKTKQGTDINVVQEKIKKKMKINHEEDTFTVITSEQMLDMVKRILSIMKVILVSIACISIVVGGIGIANSVYTSVMERIKEIGILKSIGAKISDIIFVFVSESVILSVIGGIIGLFLGIGIAKLVEWYAKSQSYDIFSIVVTPQIVLLALGLAVVVGIIAGLFPAYKAAKKKPVDALKNMF